MSTALNQPAITTAEAEQARQLVTNLLTHARAIGQEQADRIRLRLKLLVKSWDEGRFAAEFAPSNLRTCAAEALRLLDRATA